MDINCLLVQWHSLSREEQAKYYEKARQERQLHMQLYPGWSARDNYGYGTKKKKRKKERTPVEAGGTKNARTITHIGRFGRGTVTFRGTVAGPRSAVCLKFFTHLLAPELTTPSLTGFTLSAGNLSLFLIEICVLVRK